VANRADLANVFAEYATGARYEQLPQSAVEGAKKTILDTLGVILAASGMEPAVRDVVDFVKQSGGQQESTILGFGGRVPAMMAAFANGAMAHCLDFDDQTPWGQHSASSLIPAVFAIAERRGGISGKEMLTAVAIGQDLFNRLRQHVDWRKEWMFSTVIGVFCAATASARLLGLSSERVAHAIGIASMQSCGLAEVVNSTGSDLRALYAGFPAKGAVLAALLAEKGVTGVPGVFEAERGVMANYFGGRYDRQKILAGLGEEFTGGLTLYKRWSAVGTSHSHIQATIDIVTSHDLQPDQIAEIKVFVGDYHQLMCTPPEVRRAPKTLVDAKFSLPFLVAVAAVQRDVRLSDFATAALNDRRVLDMAHKVVPVEDRSLDWKLELPPGRVEVTTNDGRKFTATGTKIPGSVEAPMTWGELRRKFDDCASVAAMPLSAEKSSAIHSMIRELEKLTDATNVLSVASESRV
jgi:2-methylcitrate dehydratase PrpD